MTENDPIPRSFYDALKAPKFSKCLELSHVCNDETIDASYSGFDFTFRDQIINFRFSNRPTNDKIDIFITSENYRDWFSAPKNDYNPKEAGLILLKTIKKIFKL